MSKDLDEMIARVKGGKSAAGRPTADEIVEERGTTEQLMGSNLEEKKRKVMCLAELYEKEQLGEGTEEIRAEIGKLVAELLPEEHSNPVSEHCERVLASPPSCYSFRDMRAYASCLGWKYMDEKKIPWKEAIRQAWTEAKRVCISDATHLKEKYPELFG